MELFQWGSNPWGQEILIRISWNLLYLSFWAGIAFIVFHLIYATVWLPKLANGKSSSVTQDGIVANVPARITRHTSAARIFHWVMAATMLVLIFTGFLPIIGFQFPWLTIHWVAGILLTISILFHIVHATFVLDFWSIWILPRDLKEVWQRIKQQVGQPSVELPKHGKYPLDHRLYHLAVTIAGFLAIMTGLVMMLRIDTPLWPMNAYLFTDATWGIIYVFHGLCAVLFVTLTLTHVYFAVRPDKFWLTKSMVYGYVDREHYVQHHDPNRWVVSKESTER